MELVNQMVGDIPVGLDDDGLEPIQGFCRCAHSLSDHDRLTSDANGIEIVVCALCKCRGFEEHDPYRMGLMLVS